MQSNTPVCIPDLFFRFSKDEKSGDGIPLVCLNGGIMADTGNECKDYIFKNQYRYPVYAAMIGARPLLLTRNDSRADLYVKQLELIKKDMALLNAVVDPFIEPDFHPPLFLPCTGNWPYELLPNRFFKEQLNTDTILSSHAAGGVYLNQISPTIAAILRQFYNCLDSSKDSLSVDLDEYERMAKDALFWHNKDNYINLVTPHLQKQDLPYHVPSAVVNSHLLDTLTWPALKNLFAAKTGEQNVDTFFIKSNMEAAGEVATSICRDNFSLKISVIQKEIRDKIRLMGRENVPIKIIIQPYVKRQLSDQRPSSIGITYNIMDPSHIQRVVVIGHVYEDTDHQTFIGSFESDRHTRQVLSHIDENKIINLLRLFAQKGYRGPINLDAVLAENGRYTFIYDCNPRLGGSFPGIALKYAMQAQGHHIENLLTLGYRGRFVYPDLAAKLDQLNRLELVYTRRHPRGLCLIPSFVRPHSYDYAFINAPYEELQQILDDGILDSLSDESQRDLKGVYL